MSNPDRDEELCRQHEEFLKQVTESGMPLWMLQYYGDMHASQHQNEYQLKNPKQDESTETNNPAGTGVDDPHLFI